MTDVSDLGVQAVATISGVLVDLVDIAERLPLSPSREPEATARILDRLAEEISEAAYMLRSTVRIDGSIPAGDPRVNRARELLAEHHQPAIMSAADLRALLARFQRRTVELLGVIEQTARS
jgi:hypothetical protein